MPNDDFMAKVRAEALRFLRNKGCTPFDDLMAHLNDTFGEVCEAITGQVLGYLATEGKVRTGEEFGGWEAVPD